MEEYEEKWEDLLRIRGRDRRNRIRSLEELERGEEVEKY